MYERISIQNEGGSYKAVYDSGDGYFEGKGESFAEALHSLADEIENGGL
jgi:hypothetical protein